MSATDIIFTPAETAAEIAFATLSHIEDVARLTLADINDGNDADIFTSSF